MASLLAFLLLAAVTPVSPDLTGRVVDTSGKPIPTAHVYVYTARPKVGTSPFCPSCYKDCGKHESVDGSGAYRIRTLDPSLLFNILAVADGYEPEFTDKVDPAFGALTIELLRREDSDPQRTIAGTVVDAKAKPVVGAVVEPQGYHMSRGIVYGNWPGVEKLSITNAKGEFALRIPDAGALCDVRVHARNFAPSITRDIRPGQPARIQLRDGVTISGRVVRDGKPVAGALIGFVQRSHASRTFLGPESIGTNDEGLFVMTNLAPHEDYAVYGKMESFAPGAIPAKPVRTEDDGTSVDAGTFTVGHGHCLSAHVVVPQGWALPHHSRVLLGRIEPWDAQTTELRDDGSFEFTGIPEEEVEIAVRIPGLRLLPSSEGFDPMQVVKVRMDQDRDVTLRFGQ